jgi:hypothetical protein
MGPTTSRCKVGTERVNPWIGIDRRMSGLQSEAGGSNALFFRQTGSVQ